MKATTKTILLLCIFAIIFKSCVKDDDYSIPKFNFEEPNLKASLTVKALKELSVTPGIIEEDNVVEAYVVSNDESGNFFKTIAAVSETGREGFQIQVDREDIYQAFEPGRKIYLKTKGLYIGTENDAVVLGRNLDAETNYINRIPDTQINSHIYRSGTTKLEDKLVKTITTAQVSDSLLNTLVEITNVQFRADQVGIAYFTEEDKLGNGANRILEDAEGSLIFRVSEFAAFNQELIPEGNGTIRGVLQKYRNDYQLLIRDINDVKIEGSRKRFGYAEEITGEKITIAEVRALFTGNAVDITENKYFEGVITMSGFDNSNLTNRNVYIQDESGAIALRFSSAGQTLNQGFKVRIGLNGTGLSEFRGLLQLNLTQQEHVQFLEENVVLPIPKQVTLAEVLTGNLESQLVVIQNVQFQAESGIYIGSQIITDCVDSVPVYTATTANFAATNFPLGNGSLIAIASAYNTPQLILRTPEDASALTDNRCVVTVNEASIASIRALYTGVDTTVTDTIKIRGIVISDANTGTINNQNIILQDATGGIVVRFEASHTFNLGDEVEVILTNEIINKYRGWVQVSASLSNALKIGNGILPTPKVITVEQLKGGMFESQLIQIDAVQFDVETGTFNGNLTLTNCVDTFITYIGDSVTFAGQAYPLGNGSIVGIASVFDTPQLTLRNINDADKLTGERCTLAIINTVFFSELADPNNNTGGRFVELYNSAAEDLDLTGWVIRRYTNASTTISSTINLTGTIQAGKTFVISPNAAEFQALYGFAPDLATTTGGPADSNGDDNLELVAPDGTVIDVFGVPGEDGSNTNHEFEDGRANRKATVTQGNTTYTFSEWDVWNDTGLEETTNLPQDAPGSFTSGG